MQPPISRLAINGSLITMTITIDATGSVVIPKRLRDHLGLLPNTELEISEENGRLIIEPATTEMRLVRKGNIVRAEPVRGDLPILTTELVREILEETRS